MSIEIQEISVQNLGPLSDFQMKPGPFNLIFGPNEYGKTFLVEFVLKSLFRSARNWSLRDLSAAGQVVVTGLGDEAVSFSLSSRAKLEDHWESWRDGLPADMARLLVVKGAELSLVESEPGGINKAILQRYLSGAIVLDVIQSGISKTLQQAAIEAGNIVGTRRGEIRRRQDLQDTLETIDDLFEEVDRVHSGGRRAQLDRERARLKEEIEELVRAKRYRAWQIDSQAQDRQGKLSILSEDNLNSLQSTYHDYRRLTERILQMEKDRQGLEECCEHYEWLDRAIGVYERLREQAGIRVPRTFLIISILAFLGSIGFVLLDIPVLAVLCTLGGLVAGGTYTVQLRRLVKQAPDTEEIRRISEECETRFGKKLMNLPAMQAQRDRLQPDYYRSQTLDGDIIREREERHALDSRIHDLLRRMGDPTCETDKWDEEIDRLVQTQARLREEIQRAQVELARLDVDTSDYSQDDPGIQYSKSGLEDLQVDLSRFTDELTKEEELRSALKQRICDVTDDVISLAWNDLINRLKAERDEAADQYRQETSEIIAKILVYSEVEKIRQQEDEKIREGLSSEIVTAPLRSITGRYQRVDLEGDQLVVADPYQAFPLADLSTGAQEQVLLALRIGFASKIMGEERAFVILDDAFQHADWERRCRLMDQVVDLAKQGWQILYFTMDNHIRGLFDEVGLKHFGDQYRCVDLTAI
jgi:uncharacterized protein YhaN